MFLYRLKSLLLLAALAGVFASLGYLLFGPGGAILILTAGALLNWLSLGRARALILRIHRARPLSWWEAPQLHRIARDLAARAGMEQVPRLMVYPSDMPNAFALATGKTQTVIAASTSLLHLLPPRELRGVLAHEFAHLKNRDSVFSLASGIFVQVIALLSQGFSLLLLLMWLTGGLDPAGAGLLPTVVFAAAAPAAATLLQAGLMRTRERLADREAAELTGDPRGLASALYRLQQYSRYLSGWLRRFRFIYTSGFEHRFRWLQTHPPTDERVEDLLQMEKREEAIQVARPVARRIPVTPPTRLRRYHLVA